MKSNTIREKHNTIHAIQFSQYTLDVIERGLTEIKKKCHKIKIAIKVRDAEESYGET